MYSSGMRLPGFCTIARSRLVVAGAVVLAAAGAALGVAPLLDDDSVPMADADTIALVSDFAIAVTSFDHRTAEQDIAEVLAFGTSDFETDFRSAMGGDFLPGIQASRSVSVGQILAGPTLQSRVDGSSTLLVILNQTISSELGAPDDVAAESTTTSGADATEPQAPRVVRVGMLVTVDDAADKISSVQIL
jgi:hypothetical protein